MVRLALLLAELDSLRVSTAAAVSAEQITSIEYDSRHVAPGSLFVAMRGGSTDGNRYVDQAIRAGAAAIVTDSADAFDQIQRDNQALPLVLVAEGRLALAQLSAALYGHPERSLSLSGITGTNGKTTTAFLLNSLLQAEGRTTVLAGTIEYQVAGKVMPSPHTTPESREIYALLRQGVNQGATEVVMEVSSHALDQGRVYGLEFDAAVFTNLTRDHLDYHGTMDDYFAAKLLMFNGSRFPAPRIAVLNAHDPTCDRLAAAATDAGSDVLRYGIACGQLQAGQINMTPSGMDFAVTTPSARTHFHTHLTGRVNVLNLLAATGAALARGLTLEQIAAFVPDLSPVPGRFQTVDCGQPFTVVVDYAHTDDALQNVLTLAREFVQHPPPGTPAGRVLTLFGCGGDRDRTKRTIMGRTAADKSDLVVVTSDNPRSEDPQAIVDEILTGMHNSTTPALVELDRALAIRLLLQQAQPGDIAILAGKGHEKTQTFADKTIALDDVAIAESVLHAQGYHTQKVNHP